MRGTLCCWAWLTSLVLSVNCLADDMPVYTEPEQAGVDYRFQGEFRGYQRALPTDRSSEPIGLQVIARGDGKFEAVKYYNGLPGDGWWGGERYLLSGELVDGVVQFYGDRYAIVIEEQSGSVFDADGRIAGSLTKIRRSSPTMHAPPPDGAIALFSDSDDTSHWKGASTTDSGLLEAGCETADGFGDFHLHAEFRLPFKPHATGQARGNSGFYLQGRYEVQVLDSFGLEGLANECGGLYRTRPPDVNMCLPSLQWQTYDIVFRTARFDEAGDKLKNARISVWHNGVAIHDQVEIPNKTGAGRPEGPEPLPTKLQDHGNPVVFRNIWLVPLDEPGTDSQPELPSRAAPVPVAIVP